MSTRTVTVSVTSNDIARGSTNMCNRCPVVLALARALDGDMPARRFDLEVQPSRIVAVGSKYVVECETPPEVREFVLAWDAGEDPKPFTFQVPARDVSSAPLPKHWIWNEFKRLAGAGQTVPVAAK